METVETKTTKVINLSQIHDEKSLSIGSDWHKEYPVKRSDNPRCIYKAFKDMDNTGIFIRMRKINDRGSFGLGLLRRESVEVDAGLYELKNEHGNPTKNFREDPIEVILDEKVNLSTESKKENEYSSTTNFILIKGDKTSLAMYAAIRPEEDIIENKDGFFFDHHGILFDANKFISFYSSEKLNDPESIFNKLNWFTGKFKDRDQKNRFLHHLAKTKGSNINFELGATENISKTLAIVKPFHNEMLKDPKDYISLLAFKMIMEASKRTINNVKFSVVINKIFGSIKTQAEFEAKLIELSEHLQNHSRTTRVFGSFHEKILDSIPEARDIKKDALKRKSTGAINKIMDDLDFIKIDEKQYPLTHSAIFSGDIPKGTFFRKSGDSYFVYNDNWDIWEEMLALHRDVAIAIATECSRRTTFEKDIMSYFFFVLHKLPEYLEKQTGRKWKCFPKLVSAERELDPPTEGDNGVAKSRSALTPIVDNEKNEVVVPYVSMRLSGYQTSYCYGLDYNVLERGMSFKGNSVTRDVEKDLNGRDDYGLMFYTLTGSAQAQGYPTFLIIFEHLDTTTRVHFHRTHPMRSKGGDYNPIHGWVIGCYKWMVGNVNFERIKAQQGDLVFVEVLPGLWGTDDKFNEVNAYDNHVFEHPVKFIAYDKKEKSNILGYFRIEKDTMLNHHEHKPRLIPAGDYELRQCRSWEANPKGIWSLRID